MKCLPEPCAHGNHCYYANYSHWESCWTDGTCHTYHCRICGWFISECPAGCCDGADKISPVARATIRLKKASKVFCKLLATPLNMPAIIKHEDLPSKDFIVPTYLAPTTMKPPTLEELQQPPLQVHIKDHINPLDFRTIRSIGENISKEYIERAKSIKWEIPVEGPIRITCTMPHHYEGNYDR